MTREKRVSPDGNSVAIRSDYDALGPTAWGVFVIGAGGGGGWASAADVAKWEVLVPAPRA